jgi:hypothetical protein
MRPPSNAAVIFLDDTAGTEKAESYRRTWRAWRSGVAAKIGVSTRILSHIKLLRYARQPAAAPG